MTTPFRPLRSAGYALLAGLFLLPAINAEAGFGDPFAPVKDTLVNIQSASYGNAQGGGAFKMVDNASGASFLTFCLELTEHIWLGQTVRSGGFGDHAVWGGETVGGSEGREVDYRTRYLFRQFAIGEIDNTFSDNGWANALQAAIWHFQGFTQGNDAGQYTVHYSWQDEFDVLVADAESNANSSLNYGVFATNLFKEDIVDQKSDFWKQFDSFDPNTFDGTNLNGFQRQDMLVYLPGSPSATIPEPSTIAVWSLAMFGLVVAGRRRLKARVA